MTGIGMDVRTAIRAMARRPLFTLTCVLTLALGFGSTTAVFTVVDSVILRSLPYPESDKLVMVHACEHPEEGSLDRASGADFLDWKAQSTSLKSMAGYVSKSFNLTGADFPVRVRGSSVTPEFFSVLGVKAAIGRTLAPEIDHPGAEPSAVVSDGFWRSHFSADPKVVGSTLSVDGDPFTVVGVMPPGFDYPADSNFWASSPYRVPDPPLDVGEDPAENRGANYFNVIARLNDSVDLAAAQSEMTAVADRLAREYPDTNTGEGIIVRSLMDSVVGDARPRLLLLLASAGLVLVIACVNVAGMLLARATERLGEIGLRLAIGAERRRIVRLFLTESFLLAMTGSLAGFAVAAWGTTALLRAAPEHLPRTGEVAMDLRVLAVTALAVVGASILFGLVPAAQALRHNQRPIVNGGRGGPEIGEASRVRRWLVVSEVAATLVLVIGTGLVIRTFAHLNAVEPGFDAQGLLAGHIAMPDPARQENDAVLAFHRTTLEKLRALPGVESASTVLTLPMHWNIRGVLSFSIEGQPEDEDNAPEAGYQVVETAYFDTMHIPLLRGRLFDEGDVEDAPPVALINKATANLFWPGEDPIGRRVSWGTTDDGERDWVTIVGVVDDVFTEGLDTPPRPETFRPFAQDPYPYMTFVLRTGDDPSAYALPLRQAVFDVDPGQPVSGVTTLDEVLAAALAPRRFNMVLMLVFAGVAVALAAVGLFGMLSFSVSRRRHEIAVRRALGALPHDITVQFISEGARMLAIGLAVGTAAALALAHLITAQIYGVTATDPMTYVVAALVLASVGLLASYLPARRAARVEPMTVLRTD
jgi:predicted permease